MAVAVLTAITASYLLLVVLGNVTDYGTNRAFVEHVLAMDTTFQSPNTMWRAITSPGLVTVAYLAIIAWEAVAALVLVAAFVSWLRVVFGGQDAATARLLSSTGLVMVVLLFGGGFIAIGGEWFQMWQSKSWNGLQAALQNFLVASVGLVLVHVVGRERKPA
jgi:predicted small integral membrane protein